MILLIQSEPVAQRNGLICESCKSSKVEIHIACSDNLLFYIECADCGNYVDLSQGFQSSQQFIDALWDSPGVFERMKRTKISKAFDGSMGQVIEVDSWLAGKDG